MGNRWRAVAARTLSERNTIHHRYVCSSTLAVHQRPNDFDKAKKISWHWGKRDQQNRKIGDSRTNTGFDDVNNNGQSFHSAIHHILKQVPMGRMSESDIAKSRSFLSILSNTWHTEHGATLCESLLERMHDEMTIGENPRVVLDAEMYNVCMMAWNKCSNANVNGEMIIQRVKSIMTRMEERSKAATMLTQHPRPDRFGYNIFIDSYSKWGSQDVNYSSEREVEAILLKMNNLTANADDDSDLEYMSLIRPDTVTYNSIMNFYASSHSRGTRGAQRAEDILLLMSKEASARSDGSLLVDCTSFNTVLKAWANSGGGFHAAKRAEMILRKMIQLRNDGHDIPLGRGRDVITTKGGVGSSVRHDPYSFTLVISAYSRVDTADYAAAVDRVTKLLDDLEGMCVDGDDVEPCYNAAANLFVKCCGTKKDAIDRIEKLMDRMRQNYPGSASSNSRMLTSYVAALVGDGSDDESLQRWKEMLVSIMMRESEGSEPDSVPFNVLLDRVIKGCSPNKFKHADEVITSMDSIGGNARPDLTTYSIILGALSSCPTEDSEEKAVDYLRGMLKSYREGYEKARPSSFVFNCVIGMLTRSEQPWADNVIHRTMKSMESQRNNGNTFVVPDTITYNMVIGKLAKNCSKENAKKVMDLLGNMNNDDASAPDIITYTNVLKIQGKVDPQRASDIAFSYLESIISSNKKVQVDRLGLQALLLALSRSFSLEHARMARRTWEWMETNDKSKLLDSNLCNLVLVAFSNATHALAVEEALYFLSERINRCSKVDIAVILPTVVGFGAVLVSLSKVGRVDEAVSLLLKMRMLHEKGVPNVKPDEACYQSILGPLSHEVGGAPLQALKVVQLMKEDLGMVSTVALNAAMRSCSTESHDPTAKRQAIEIAFIIFQLGRESKACDEITFGLMMRNVNSLTDCADRRIKLLEVSFVHVCLLFFDLG